MKRYKILVNLAVFAYIVAVIVHYWDFLPLVMERRGWEDIGVGCDFRIYYEAARGNFTWAVTQDWRGLDDLAGWCYPNFTAVYWFWSRGVEFAQALRWQTLINTVCFLILIWKVMKYDYGFLFAVAATHSFIYSLECGNIIPQLALGLLSPFGCVFFGLFKWWPVGVLGLHFLLGTSADRSPIARRVFLPKGGRAVPAAAFHPACPGDHPRE